MKKKIISIIVSVSMVLSLAACGSSKTEGGLVMPDYKNLEVEDVQLIEVTDADVQGYIDYMLSANAQSKEITDRPAQEGDTVNIDYVGLLDGVAFEGGTAEGQTLTIGAGGFIDGFEDGIVGANVGDELELELTFPEDYQSEDLKGQDVIFEITVNAISEEIIPEYSDEFVQEVSTTSTTMDEYYDEIHAMYEAENLATRDESRELQMWTALIDATEVKEFPEEDLEGLKSEVSAYYETYAQYYGLGIEEFVAASGMTMDEYEVILQDTAEEIYISEIVVTYIAEQEGLTPTEEEYQEEIDAIVELYGYESEEALYEESDRESVKMDVLTDIVMAWLMENVAFTEESETTEEVTTEEATTEEATTEE